MHIVTVQRNQLIMMHGERERKQSSCLVCSGCIRHFPQLHHKCCKRKIKPFCGSWTWIFPSTVAICDNKYYSCAIFPLCVWEIHTGCFCSSWPETRSGRPQWPPTENENRVLATFPELLSLQERKSVLGSVYFCPPWFLTAVWRGPGSLLPRVRYK